MSKKDKKKGKKGGGKKEKAARLPKSIAGIPLSKELRDAVEPVLEWAGHPLVSEALSAGLLAGVTALSGKKPRSAGGKAVGAAAAGAGAGAAASATGKGTSPVGLALAIAAGEIASKIVAAYEQGSGEPQDPRPGKR